MYKLYVYNYECGLVRYKENTLRKIEQIIKILDPSEYGNYIIIDDDNEIIDNGYIIKPHIKKLKKTSK